MMRSLFSGVSGLKTHQTRMDVIGNNIANVNTTAYKAQNMVFSDLLYQTTQAASGANADTGRGGINARQIGLGSKTAAINTAITRQGSAQSTNNPWDVMISGESFFIVNSGGSQNFFTRDGAFTIDGAGNLVMASTGYRVMGWQVDPETGDIRSDVVSALQVMNEENMTAPAEFTTKATAQGILDRNDTNVHSTQGKAITLQFFDGAGYEYTAKFSAHALDTTKGQYYVQLDDIIDSDGVSLKKVYGVENINQIATFGTGGQITETKVFSPMNNVTYVDKTTGTAASTGDFKVNYDFGEVLEGFANSPIMGVAGDTVQVDGMADGAALAAGAAVNLTGQATLTKDVLQKDYGLVYDEKERAYYYQPKPAAGATTAPARVKLTENLTDASVKAAWESVLSQLSGTDAGTGGGTGTTATAAVTLNTIGINDKGEVTLDFGAQFNAVAADKLPANTTYNASTGKFAATLTYPDTTTDPPNATILEKAFGLKSDGNTIYTINYVSPNGYASITSVQNYGGNLLVFDTDSGKFSYVGSPEQDVATLTFAASTTNMSGETVDLGHFANIDIDFSAMSNVNNGKVSTANMDNGDGSSSNLGSGRKAGKLIGVEIAQDGKIRASYDNGMSKLLCQIAVAKFANPGGLSKAGNNLYSTTMNSGDFDGIGVDITADGEGSMESGVLEMSNVDLAGEFTEMITTQRGFQANSRIITTSDTMLEELVNLKR